ncbi:MAG: DUF4215 domain-containing protein, partial [Deltaproteobacteria bacterium]|nr:DUF4215 domain-containing protein [Deltaproteobacteria bacterium]
MGKWAHPFFASTIALAFCEHHCFGWEVIMESDGKRVGLHLFRGQSLWMSGAFCLLGLAAWGGPGCTSHNPNYHPQAVCGNGAIEADEECDDGNVADGDGCSSQCKLETDCGNGVKEGVEQCDDGNVQNGDGCSDHCTLEPVCGNGTIEADEECDDGNVADGDGCSSQCKLETDCGNGVKEGVE